MIFKYRYWLENPKFYGHVKPKLLYVYSMDGKYALFYGNIRVYCDKRCINEKALSRIN
jgi:hypothetical protein